MNEPGIGQLKERSLHAAIKEWYSRPADRVEEKVGQYIVDIARDDLLLEIQTGSFSKLKKKLAHLLLEHRVRLVYPLPRLRWIVKVARRGGKQLSRRKSPRRGKLTDIFDELVSIPELIANENFSLDVLITEEEEVRCDDGKGSWWRKRTSIRDRRLLNIEEKVELHRPEDFLRFLPAALPCPFTNRQLAAKARIRIHLVRKMTYCMRKMGAIKQVGKRGNELLFEV